MATRPNDNDVLSGRGASFNQHPGNGHFRRMLDEQKDAYMAGTKRQKMDISKAIVEAIYSMDPPGRFLKQCSKTGKWNELSRKDAADRAAQAMAYAIRGKEISERRKEERRRSRQISQRQKSQDIDGNSVVAASSQLRHSDRLPTQQQDHLQSSSNQLNVVNPSSSLSSAPRPRLASRGLAAGKTHSTTRSSAKKNDCTDSSADEMPGVPSNSNASNVLHHQQLQLLPQLNQSSAANSTNTLPTSSDQNVSQNGLLHILAQAVQQHQQYQLLLQSDLGQILLGQLLRTQTALQSASLEGLSHQQLSAQAQQQQQLIQQKLFLLQHLLNQQNVLQSESLLTTLLASAPPSASQGLLPPSIDIGMPIGALSSNYSATSQSEPASHVNASQNLRQQSNPSLDTLLLRSLWSNNLQQHPNTVGISSAPQGAQQLDQLQRSLVLQHNVQQLLAPSLNPTPTNQSFGQHQQQSKIQLGPSHQAWQAALPLQVQNSQAFPLINSQPSVNAAVASSSPRREENDADDRQSVSEEKQA